MVPLRYDHQRDEDLRITIADLRSARPLAIRLLRSLWRLHLLILKNLIFNRHSPIENRKFNWFSDVYIQEVFPHFKASFY